MPYRAGKPVALSLPLASNQTSSWDHFNAVKLGVLGQIFNGNCPKINTKKPPTPKHWRPFDRLSLSLVSGKDNLLILNPIKRAIQRGFHPFN